MVTEIEFKVLEARMEEKWDAHDRRSNERHQENLRKLQEIDNKMSKMVSCAICDAKEESLNGRINWLWGALWSSIGTLSVVITLISIMGRK